MPYDDFRALAVADAASLQEQILSKAEIADEEGNGLVVARSLANALIAVGQNFLARTSTEDDVELFFEVYNRQPEDIASWPVTILAGLRMKKLTPEDWQFICASAAETAVRYIRSHSTLAWG